MTFLFAGLVNVAAQDKITLTWQADTENEKELQIRVTSGEDFTVDWGDGTIETETGRGTELGNVVHLSRTYATAGEYTMTIEGVTANCRFVTFYCGALFLEDNQQVTSLDVSKCKALRTLGCQNNLLENLDVSGLTNLQTLDCEGNQLTKLNLSGCSALQALWVNKNQLQSLNLTNCTSLETLYCSNNQLTELDLSSYTNLQYLVCYNNQLTELDLNGCANLQTLYCYDNQLQNLNLTGCTNLSYLSCYNNQLQLSDLYAANLQVTSFNRYFGTQNLPSRTATVGEQLFADQSVFTQIITNNKIFTQYTVTRKNGSIHPLDYTVIDGKLTFNIAGDYTVTMVNAAIVTDMKYPAEVIVDMKVTAGTGITESVLSNIKIYPNPTSDSFIIDYEGLIQVKIYDMLGKEILTRDVNGKTEINISNFPKGIYNVNIFSESKIIGNSKIVKQ